MSNDPESPPSVRIPTSSGVTVRPASVAAVAPPPQPESAPGHRQPTPGPKKAPRFIPAEPKSWEEAGIDPEFVLGVALRMLVGQSNISGKQVSTWLALPLPLTGDVLNAMKARKYLEFVGTNAIGDHLIRLTEMGKKAAVESRELTSFVGAAPVPFEKYVASVEAQSPTHANTAPEDLKRAFNDISVSDDMLDRLGPAVTSCKALFLYGPPGNGKTTIAERITRVFGDAVWIPRTLQIGGTELVKLFDPAVHKEIEPDPRLMKKHRVDRRWVLIERPTVIAGGELTLDMLDLAFDSTSKVSEAPLQMKSQCGTLVIDDFGRGHTSPQDLLNRWIFPLEKRYDFLKLPDGRKVECPFDCLLVFSTNLEPRDLADEAFMRRIPYKIFANNPDEEEFKSLIEITAQKYGIVLPPHSVKYLIDRHYKMANREFRFCHPRDLLLQVVHYAEYTGTPKRCGPPEWDRVVSNYFGLS
ncbi:MAG: ATP-binding protein [Myxococcales bacterium]|nr:ATP-binding protein [Myxococcales bacterium]MCB9670136.1 AAA family ATPase [Alphaproteobacteria bacterium]MCB9693577.1 AAA family ATPase [Alphaproteobacteria bacterium]